jgi:acyl-coenzyme A synthetase/AMP-(fatty) acid ligase
VVGAEARETAATDPATGRTVPRGEVGLIEANQPGRCLDYVAEHDRHAAKVDGDWWHMGDLGVIDRTGSVRIVDREVDRIPGASGIELEDVLLDRLPDTTEVVVLAMPDGMPQPVVSTAGDRTLDAAAWESATADMPPMADPIRIAWDEFPRTATWKIRRVELRERLRPGAGPSGLGRWT